MKTEVIVGIIIAITIFAAILLAVVTLSCYICCRTKKYEYNTGNEYRYAELISYMSMTDTTMQINYINHVHVDYIPSSIVLLFPE